MVGKLKIRKKATKTEQSRQQGMDMLSELDLLCECLNADLEQEDKHVHYK